MWRAVFAPGRVEQLPEPGTRKVVLHIPRVEVIEEIEDPHPYAGVQMLFAKGQCKGARYLEVERRKAGETSDVPWSNVFAELVFHGIGKSGMNLVNRDQCQFPRRR